MKNLNDHIREYAHKAKETAQTMRYVPEAFGEIAVKTVKKGVKAVDKQMVKAVKNSMVGNIRESERKRMERALRGDFDN